MFASHVNGGLVGWMGGIIQVVSIREVAFVHVFLCTKHKVVRWYIAIEVQEWMPPILLMLDGVMLPSLRTWHPVYSPSRRKFGGTSVPT